MDGRHADEYHGARVAPVAQLDRVLPSEGSGRGFESRLVHHLLSLVQGNSAQKTSSPISQRALARGFFTPAKMTKVIFQLREMTYVQPHSNWCA